MVVTVSAYTRTDQLELYIVSQHKRMKIPSFGISVIISHFYVCKCKTCRMSSLRSNRPRVDFKKIRFTLGDHYYHNRISVISSMAPQLLSIYMDFGCEKITKSQHQAKAKQWIMLSLSLSISVSVSHAPVFPFSVCVLFFRPSLLRKTISFFALSLSFLIRLKRSVEIHVILWLFFSCHFSFLFRQLMFFRRMVYSKQNPTFRTYKKPYTYTQTHTHTLTECGTETIEERKKSEHQQKIECVTRSRYFAHHVVTYKCSEFYKFSK